MTMSSRYLLQSSALTSTRRHFSATFQRRSSTEQDYRNTPLKQPPSAHGQLYTNILPAMVPIFLLGSTIFLGLQLTQLTLSHDKFIQESNQRIRELEAEIEALQARRSAAATLTPPSNNVPDTPTPTKSRWSFW